MDRRHAQFGGELAVILWHTLKPSAMFLGAACGGLVFGGFLLMNAIELSRIAPVILQALLFLFVVRIALNSAFGDPLGGFFQSTGTNWPDSFAALGRLFLLNLIWAIPLAILGKGLSALPREIVSGGGVGGPAVLLVLALAALPPLFLVAAVGAASVSDLFDTAHWRSLFAGRWADLNALFVVYLGGALSATAVSLLVAASLGNGKPGFTIFLLLIAGSYSLGITVLLLGRLVGGFIRTGEAGIVNSGADVGPEPDAAPDDGEGWDPTSSASVFPLSEVVVRPAPSRVGGGPSGSVRTERDRSDTAPLPGRMVASASPGTANAEQRLAEPGAKASLSEVLRHVQRLAETDPEQALTELEDLLTRQGPHPMVLGHVAMLQDRLAPEMALQTAQQAADLAISVGNVGVVGELYEVFQSRLFTLELEIEQWCKVAAAQQGRGRTESATELYRHVLEQDPSNLAAIKGLIQIAEDRLKHEDQTEQALAIYDLLDRLCPDNPFTDFVEAGRHTAERRLQKVR